MDFETKYSKNELELLAVFWAIEHFKNYVYGTKFRVISDYKTLSSVLRLNRGIKKFSSLSTRWVDRLLPFEFEIPHAPGKGVRFSWITCQDTRATWMEQRFMRKTVERVVHS